MMEYKIGDHVWAFEHVGFPNPSGHAVNYEDIYLSEYEIAEIRKIGDSFECDLVCLHGGPCLTADVEYLFDSKEMGAYALIEHLVN